MVEIRRGGRRMKEKERKNWRERAEIVLAIYREGNERKNEENLEKQRKIE